MALAVVALGLATTATAGNKPPAGEIGNILFTFNGGFSPSKLPKNKLAPIALSASGKIQTKDGSHPPALKEVVVETDKNGAVDTTGFPKCVSGQLQSRDTVTVRKICGAAIIGTGRTEVEIGLQEQTPFPVKSDLSLNINKKYIYKGRRMSILSAKCADGKLQAHATAVFADGTRGSSDIVRTCTPTS